MRQAKEKWKNGIREEKMEMGYLWNFIKRAKNEGVTSFLAKEDA